MSKNNQIKLEGSSRTKTLLGILLIIASLAFYIFYTKPLVDDKNAMEESIATNEEEAQGLSEQVSRLREARAEAESINELTGNTVNDRIPGNLDQDEVIRDVIEIADQNGISLRSISFGKGATEFEGISSLRVNSSFEGNYRDLIDFLEDVENNSRFFRVASISVQLSRSEVLNFERATFSLAMEAFYRENI